MKKISTVLLVMALSLVSLSAHAYTDESGNTNDQNTVRIKKCVKVNPLVGKTVIVCKKIVR